jgi:6-phosphogluconolactonase (cycloisomerase 2 family)
MSGAITSSPVAVLTVAPAVARAAYVAATGDGYTATYILNPSAASLVPIASGNFGNAPVEVVPEPSGRFAYLLTGISILTATLDPVTGRINGLPSQITPTPNVASNQGVVDPTGQYLYVAGSTPTSGLYSYSISLRDDEPALGDKAGSLTQIGTAISGFTNLYAVITDRAGKYLYAVDYSVNKVFAYSIGAGGVLTPLATASYATGSTPQNPAIDPTNTYLYIPNQSDGSISAYTINADGSLTAVAGQPFTAGIGTAPSFIAVEATGKFLYVTNTSDSTVSALPIVAGGALGAAVAGSPFSTGAPGTFPFGIAIDPTNTSLAVSNLFGNSISMYTLTPATGVLIPAALPQVESPSGAYYITYGISTKTASVNPGIIYAANSVSGDISAFTSAAGTGVLTSTGAPLTGTVGNSLAAADLSGSFLLTGSAAGVQVGVFSTNQTSGAITALTGSPQSLAAANTASAVFVAPTDDFAYVLDTTTGSVVQYSVLSATLGTGASKLASVGVANSLAADPQGDFVYALGNTIPSSGPNGIQQFTTYGGFAQSTPTTLLPGDWISGAVDGSGQFFVAVDSNAKMLESFSITPAGTFLGTDGALTPVPSSVTLAGSGPWVVAFDPRDRVVFVADQSAGTITPYAFSYTGGGTLGAAGTATTALANGISNLSVDITGNYLYAGQKAAAAPGSKGAVAVYKIGASGALTAVAGSPFTTGTGNPGVAATNVVQ